MTEQVEAAAPKQSPPQGRVTVVEAVYWRGDGAPVVARSGFSRAAGVADEPYRRAVTVGEAWNLLDLGWFAGKLVGQVVIANEKVKFQRNPTAEDRAMADAKVLEVCLSGNGGDVDDVWLVPPGVSMRGLPKNPESLMVRCQRGETRCIVHVFPG